MRLTQEEILDGNKLIAEFEKFELSDGTYHSSWDELIRVCKKFRELSRSKLHHRLCEGFQYALYHMNIEGCFQDLVRCIKHRNENKEI